MLREVWRIVICPDCRCLLGATDDWQICPATGFRHKSKSVRVAALATHPTAPERTLLNTTAASLEREAMKAAWNQYAANPPHKQKDGSDFAAGWNAARLSATAPERDTLERLCDLIDREYREQNQPPAMDFVKIGANEARKALSSPSEPSA